MVSTLLKVVDVAEQLDVSPQTVYKLIYTGELKALRVGRLFKVQKLELEAFKTRNSTS
jgi:excisionase family DNA binding protein